AATRWPARRARWATVGRVSIPWLPTAPGTASLRRTSRPGSCRAASPRRGAVGLRDERAAAYRPIGRARAAARDGERHGVRRLAAEPVAADLGARALTYRGRA